MGATYISETPLPTVKNAPSAAQEDMLSQWLRRPSETWPPYLIGQRSVPVRVLLVDSDSGMRRNISHDFAADGRIVLMGEEENFAGALRTINRRHDFDLLMVALHLADGNGLELVQAAKRTREAVEAIVLSHVDDERQAIKAFQAGASGFLHKHSWFRDFVRAVLEVVNGGFTTSPVIVRRLVTQFGEAHEFTGTASPPPTTDVTQRERAVLQLIAAGHTSDEVAQRLAISEQTVNSHVRNIFRKLHAHSRAQAVAVARIRGLVPQR